MAKDKIGIVAFATLFISGIILLIIWPYVLPDQNLIPGKDGIAYYPYEDYGPRSVDVVYGLAVAGVFLLSVILPLRLLWVTPKTSADKH